MSQDSKLPIDVHAAETEALATQAAEDQAEQRFDAVHAELETAGRVEEATRSSAFREWMEARARTDAAWGRWALAVDAMRSRA
jgi:hypothetical protein